MNNWITITNFNHTKNGFGDNYFIRNNEDGTQTYFKDDLTQFSNNDLKTLLENNVPNKFTDNLNNQSGTGIQHGGVKVGFITKEGFDRAVSNIPIIEEKDEDRKKDDSYIYNQYDWSYSTGTKGVDLITRYLYNLSLPSMFMDIMFTNDPIWSLDYPINKKMQDFDSKANINNIINLYFKIPDNKKIIKITDNEKNRTRLFDLLKERLTTTAGKKQTKLLYLLQKNVSCINTFCPNLAVAGGNPKSIKMRQECETCKGRDDDSSRINGLAVMINNNGDIRLKKSNIIFVCPRFCVNSKIKVNTKTWDQDGEIQTPIIYENKRDPADRGPLKDKDGNPFFCPISWDKYRVLVTGVFEIDHKNGNHWDNSIENVQSLCKICHETKSVLSKDKSPALPGSPESITVILQNEINDIENDNNKLIEQVLKRVNKYRQFCLDNDLDSNEVFTLPINYDAELKNVKDLFLGKENKNISIKILKEIIRRLQLEYALKSAEYVKTKDALAPTKLRDALIAYLQSKI